MQMKTTNYLILLEKGRGGHNLGFSINIQFSSDSISLVSANLLTQMYQSHFAPLIFGRILKTLNVQFDFANASLDKQWHLYLVFIILYDLQ